MIGEPSNFRTLHADDVGTRIQHMMESAWAGAGLALTSAIGYAFAKDWRRALYFFFGACITVVAMWK